MSVLIIGSGMAGLVAAVHIKELSPDGQVVVVEQPKQEGNTLIAGQRLRSKRNEALFPVGSNGVTDSFISTYPGVLDYWTNIIGAHEESNWFGPQLAGGKGKIVLQRMRDKAKSVGVDFLVGTAVSLQNNHDMIEGVIIERGSQHNILQADSYVLANGGGIGKLFNSTNIPIPHNGHMLAYDAGIPLVGSTVNMFHPFGKCSESGDPNLGCFGTDDLVGVHVYTADGELDKETMQLLDEHKAHEKFPSICARFIERGGGRVTLQFPDGRIRNAQVALHHSLLGVDTTDGVMVRGIQNLFVSGDAGSFGYATGFINRPAGTGQLKALVDGYLISELIRDNQDLHHPNSEVMNKIVAWEVNPPVCEVKKELKAVNTEGILKTTFARSEDEARIALEDWRQGLLGIVDTNLTALSLGIVNAYGRKPELQEPIQIRKEMGGSGRCERL